MIPSEVSGVAFSLNPSNNDYDEAVINSNYGVGETVVSGAVNPDFYLINKPKKLILSKKLGKKEHFLFLKKSGGLEETQNQAKSSLLSLTDQQAIEITCILERIESLFDLVPIDIKWAFFQGKLFILQARPITTHLKLPKSLQTEKHETRFLFLDATLVVQGFNKPFSILGASFIESFLSKMGERVLGDANACDVKKGIVGVIGGKIFINLANVFAKASKETVGKNFKNMNPNVGEIILNLFEAEKKYFGNLKNFENETEEEKANRLSFHRYTADRIPECLNFSKLGMLWRMPVAKFIFPNFLLNKIKSGISNGIADYEDELKKYQKIWQDKSQTLGFICESFILDFTYLFSQRLLPAIVNGVLNGIDKLKDLFQNENIILRDKNECNDNYSFKIEDLVNKKDKLSKAEIKFLIENLTRSLPNNVTTKMALDLFDLAEI